MRSDPAPSKASKGEATGMLCRQGQCSPKPTVDSVPGEQGGWSPQSPQPSSALPKPRKEDTGAPTWTHTSSQALGGWVLTQNCQAPRRLGCHSILTSLVAQTVKHLPTMWKTRVRSLGWEDPLEKGMVTHSCTLAWRIPWMEEPGSLPSMGSQRVRHE